MAIDLHELYWAAGFLEGEGSFVACGPYKQPRISCPQLQRAPLERLQRLFGGGICDSERISTWYCAGPLAAGLMMTLWTLMSPKRREQIEAALKPWREKPLFRSSVPAATGKCQRGHDWVPQNISTHKSGLRFCRLCNLERQKRAYRARRAKMTLIPPSGEVVN